MTTTDTNEFARGWRIVAGGAVGTMFGISALPFYTLGVFVKPIAAATGWSRQAIQSGIAVQMLTIVSVGWLYGIAVDRWGARRVGLASQAGLGCALASLALTGGSLTSWYLGWFAVGLLGAGTSPLTWTRGIATWFTRARGAALGLALAGTGITGFVAPPLVTRVVADHGWGAGYAMLGLGVWLIAMPLVALLFHDPPARPVARSVAPDPARTAALRDYRFWVVLLVFALVTIGIAGLIPNLVPLLTDRGMSARDAALYASLAGLSVIIGRVGTGLLLDRFWAPGVAAALLLLPAASCLALAGDALPGGLATGVAAVLLGLAAGSEFDLIAFLTARYFGLRHYGFVYSLQSIGLLLASGFAPPLFGHIHDATGSYASALGIAAACFLVAPPLLLTLGRYPRGDALPQAAPT